MCEMLKPCRLSAGLISPPPKGHKGYDLNSISHKLRGAGYNIRACTARILIVRAKKGLETSIYPSGKLLIKTKDLDAARAECTRIRAIMDDPAIGK